MGAPVFWFIKIFALLAAGAAAALFLWLDDGGPRGALGAAIYSLLGLGLFFKDGFSLRQWTRKDYYGVNQAMRWFGLGLAALAAAATAIWVLIWVIQHP